MATLTGIRLPIPWDELGFPPALQTRTTTLVSGEPAWNWDQGAPDLGIPAFETKTGEGSEGWDLDHVVLLVPDIDDAIAGLLPVGTPRIRTRVDGRAAAFYRVGPLLEVIESPVRGPALFGLALVANQPLTTVALEWRSRGLDISDPEPATQPGRRIFTVRGLNAALAVISPDGERAAG